MNLRKKAILFITIVILLTIGKEAVNADIFSPSPSCIKPSKPFTNDEYLWLSFKYDVERYKRCIEDFIEDQDSEIKLHQEAQRESAEEWNHFVRWELN